MSVSNRMQNISSERMKSYYRVNAMNVMKDPIVQYFIENNRIEVTPKVISKMTKDDVKNKRKTRVSTDVTLLQPETKVYNLNLSKKARNIKYGMKVSLFDKSFERDMM